MALKMRVENEGGMKMNVNTNEGTDKVERKGGISLQIRRRIPQ